MRFSFTQKTNHYYGDRAITIENMVRSSAGKLRQQQYPLIVRQFTAAQ